MTNPDNLTGNVSGDFLFGRKKGNTFYEEIFKYREVLDKFVFFKNICNSNSSLTTIVDSDYITYY